MKTRPIKRFSDLRPGMLLVDVRSIVDEIETVLSVDKENGTYECIWVTKHGEIIHSRFSGLVGDQEEIICDDEVEEK